MSDSELSPGVIEDITEALAAGQKIEAIKIYRTATAKDLKASKDFIDQLIPALVEKDAERFADLNNQGVGCGAAVLTLSTFIGLLLSAITNFLSF